ncbi:MAG: DNA primase DnaG [Candidatus Thermoplasmatota archaeon]|nr:DNA primase DnaG [Candidatus Thermoplasmatota archaeon]
MSLDPATTKYQIQAKLTAEGIVEKADVVGAIFGQTEGLLGDELDLRDLQKTGRMGRIEVDILSKKGRSEGTVTIPSSLDQVETAILASALETIDRVGPCRAKISVDKIEDVRISKKHKIVERAKELLSGLIADGKEGGLDLAESVRQAVQIDEVILYGEDKCPAGPNIESSDAIILVEGRSDVINLLKYGIKNCVAIGGTSVPETIKKLTSEKVVTAFVDGDRGGELILKELFQVAEIDFVARAQKGFEVEELTQKQIIKSLRNKIPLEQFLEMFELPQEVKDRLNGQIEKNAERDRKEPRDHHPKDSRDRDPRRDPRDRNGDDRKVIKIPRREEKPEEVRPSPSEEVPERPEEKVEKPQEKAAPNPEIPRYRDILKNLSGTLKAMLINGKGDVVMELAVRQLADTLKSPPEPVHAVIFDGIISQRLLDIASEQKIKYLVGSKKGKLTKEPDNVLVLSREELTS